MKKLFMLLAATFVPAFALADFNGAWQGKDGFSDGDGYSETCFVMKLDLAQTPTSFAINSGLFECESLKIAWKPFTFNVQDGEILDKDGNRLGTADENYFFAKVIDSQTNWVGIYQIEITTDGMEYKQTTLDESGNIIFTIEGLFQK